MPTNFSCLLPSFASFSEKHVVPLLKMKCSLTREDKKNVQAVLAEIPRECGRSRPFFSFVKLWWCQIVILHATLQAQCGTRYSTCVCLGVFDDFWAFRPSYFCIGWTCTFCLIKEMVRVLHFCVFSVSFIFSCTTSGGFPVAQLKGV